MHVEERGSNPVISGDGVGNSNRGNRRSNCFVGADRYSLDNRADNGSNSSNSVVGGDRADDRANNRGNIAVGVWNVVVDKCWVSLSISFTLGNQVVSAVCVIGVSSISSVGMIGSSTVGQVLSISVGFRLSRNKCDESENYKHLHIAEVS